MNPASQTICLNMIVKNEASVIRRCIDSVRAIIDHWVIIDTGSTDGTQTIIREYLSDIPGELYERPWRDFSYNRSEALRLAREKCDYTLIIDADDTLDIAPHTILPPLSADSYMLEIVDAQIVYRRTQVVRSALPWRYEGVLHEYLACDCAGSSEVLSQIKMRRNHDGARRKDPRTYQRDADVLEKALLTETNPFLLARYRFYLAQSYRDCGHRASALKHYLARADMGFWQEEVFISLYSAAKLMEQLGYPQQEVIGAYDRATSALPSRTEALHGASRFCRQKKRYEQGYQIAKRGLGIPMPSSDALFVEPWIYQTGLLDEFSLNAFWSGHNRDCLDACLKLLKDGGLSPGDARRIVANAQFACNRLAPDPDLGVFGADHFAEQHALAPPRQLGSRLVGSPRVFIAILAHQSEAALPLYLECIEALDYPKSSIVIYIKTFNNDDTTEHLLREWMGRVGHLYDSIELDAKDVDGRAGETRFRVLGHLYNHSMKRATDYACDFFFMANLGSFVRSCTLHDLVALNLPVVAPLLRSVEPNDIFSIYHSEVDTNGYFKECDQYTWILNRWVRGVLEVPAVNSVCLVRSDMLSNLSWVDDTARHEYVVFSESVRKREVPMYLDNRQIYGYHILNDRSYNSVTDAISRAQGLLETDA